MTSNEPAPDSENSPLGGSVTYDASTPHPDPTKNPDGSDAGDQGGNA